MDIGKRIYYEKATGNVLVDTGERSGSVVETTIEQDFESYLALSERVAESIGCIQLEYGQYFEDFSQCNGYRVNIESSELEFTYPDPSNSEEPPVYQKPLTQEVGDLKARMTDLEMFAADIIAST